MSETSTPPEQKSSPLIWHILGVGSIGGLFAAHISASGHTCRLLLKPHQHTLWQEHRGITLEVDSHTFTQRDQLECDSLDNDTAIERLIITTKAYDTLPALKQIAQRITPKTVIYLLQNGMGIADAIRQQFPGITLLSCTTTEGAYRPHPHINPFHIVHAGRNQTLVEFNSHHPEYTQWLIDACGTALNITAVEDIDAYLWRKLAINAVINPLTALNNCTNGELAQLPLRIAVNHLCDELDHFAAHAPQGHYLNKIRQSVFNVINDTANNCSSMRADLLAQRPTEIDYITGFLCDQAAQLGITLPRHAALLELIRLKQTTH